MILAAFRSVSSGIQVISNRFMVFLRDTLQDRSCISEPETSARDAPPREGGPFWMPVWPSGMAGWTPVNPLL
ncbi:MAG: hypothetical protein ACOX0O_12110 [Candidatus Methanoculleus thermohydrogenotrophicum]|jgi:hypothetical protein